jgi:hypothetical protein
MPPVILPPGTTGCVTGPSRCGFPDASNTGPSGSLAVSTRTQYQTAGEVVRDVEIRGCVDVRAANVTFRNVRFVGNGCHYLVRNSSSGLRIEDSEGNCNNGPNSAMAGPGGFTVVRTDIHHCENGFDVQANNVTVQDSYIHDLYDGGDSHTDGMQFGQGASNITVAHNSIIVSMRATSAIIMWDEGGAQNANVTIANNLFSGANYTLRCARYGSSTNVYVTGNRFGPNVSGYDKTDSCTGGHVTSWSGNVLDANGAALAAS